MFLQQFFTKFRICIPSAAYKLNGFQTKTNLSYVLDHESKVHMYNRLKMAMSHS